MLENPRKFCIHDSLFPTTESPPLGVSECACLNTGAYDRLINDRRSRFENEMIKTLKSQFQNRDQTIRLMSIGSGGLLQEAIFLGRLILEDFSSFEITLVDIHGTNESFGNLRRFFRENFSNIQITWQCAKTVADIHHKNKFDLIYVIDFDELFSFYEKNEFMVDYGCLIELVHMGPPLLISLPILQSDFSFLGCC